MELVDGLTTVPPVCPTQPHLPADKAWGAPGPEQQHLLTGSPSSSSSSLESSASTTDKATDKGPPSRDPLPTPGTGKASGSGEVRASARSSGKRREPTWLHPCFVLLPSYCLSHLLLGFPCGLRPELLALPH